MLKNRRVEQPMAAAPPHQFATVDCKPTTAPSGAYTQRRSGEEIPGDSGGSAQVRAARAASAAATAAAQSIFTPLALPAHAHAQPQPQSARPRDPAAPAAPADAKVRARVEVIVPEVVTDVSCRRVNSAGITVFKQYRRGRYLGKGGFAMCYELQSLDSHKIYAGKVIPKASVSKDSAKKKLIAEISIHRRIQHTHVVKFERFFEDSINVYILLEICTNHTLMELVKRRQRLTETETQFYMWQLTNTMMYLHQHNIIHRDLKLGNLFLNENLDLRIGDFGLAAQLEHADERKRTICGTPNYIAPEILDNKNGHSFEVDTWAMGVIMYTMLIGQPPFETASVKSTYERIRDNSYQFPAHIAISPAARSLIERILSSAPDQRPSLAEMKNDPFFTQSPFPKQLPLSCLKTPLVWKHSYQSSDIYTAGQENFHVATSTAGVPGNSATRTALTSRALNTMPAQAIDAKSQGVVKLAPTVSRPMTAPVTREVKVASPQAQAPPPKRLSRAAPIDVCPVPAPLALAPAPSPTYTSTEVNPKAFFKELMPSTAIQTTAQIAVPKRASGERRVTRRSGGDEEAQEEVKRAPIEDELVGGMKALDLKADVAPQPQAAEEADADEDQEDVQKMHDEIERSFCTPASVCITGDKVVSLKPAASVAAPPLIPAELWVNKWVDYSNKYGLGYLLSNGDSGVYFNDSSKAILSADGENFEYLERKATGSDASAMPERQFHTLSNFPPALQKKVTLLKHFMNYLVPSTDDVVKPTAPSSPSSASSPASRVYVKKWLRTKHAIFFRLSNRTVQVIFLDHTELVLSSQHNSVTYTDKNKKRETYSLDRESGEAGATQDKPDLAKRMKYTKDILHHLLTRTAGAPAPEQ